MTEENNNANSGQNPATAADKAGNQSENKTFTQEEVNEIVEKRLSRQKNKYENAIKGLNPEFAEIEEREQSLVKRELEFQAKQELMNTGIPIEAISLLNLESEETLGESLEILKEILNKMLQPMIDERLKGTRPLKEAPINTPADDSIRSAFGLK